MSNPFNNQNNGQFDALNQVMNNPMFQMLRNKGMNYEQIVRFMCEQKGIDVNQLLQQAQLMKSNYR